MDISQSNQPLLLARLVSLLSKKATYCMYMTKVTRKKMSKIEQIYKAKKGKDYLLKVPSFSCWQALYFQILTVGLLSIINFESIQLCPGIFINSKDNSPQVFYISQQMDNQMRTSHSSMQKTFENSKAIELIDKIEQQIDKMTLDAVQYYQSLSKIKQNQKQYIYQYKNRIKRVSLYIRQELQFRQTNFLENTLFIQKIAAIFYKKEFLSDFFEFQHFRQCSQKPYEKIKIIEMIKILKATRMQKAKDKINILKKKRKLELNLSQIIGTIKRFCIPSLIICSEPGNQIKIDQIIQRDQISQQEQENIQSIKVYFRIRQVVFCISVDLEDKSEENDFSIISEQPQRPQMFEIKIIFLTNMSQKTYRHLIGVLVSDQCWQQSQNHKYYFFLQKKLKFQSQSFQKRIFNYRKSLLVVSTQKIPQYKFVSQLENILEQIAEVYYSFKPLIEQLSYLQNLRVIFKSSVQKRQQIYETKKGIAQLDEETKKKLSQIENVYDQTNQIKLIQMQLSIFNHRQQKQYND